jgi:hypothetical protein
MPDPHAHIRTFLNHVQHAVHEQRTHQDRGVK